MSFAKQIRDQKARDAFLHKNCLENNQKDSTRITQDK